MMQYIDGRKIRNEILEELKQEVSALPYPPLFCDILVGSDPASVQYVAMKNRVAARIGIGVLPVHFPDTTTTDQIITKIRELNANPHLAGLIVQLPLPAHIDKRAVLDAIDPVIDVDATGVDNTERFYADDPRYIFPTANSVMELLKRTGRLSADQRAVVVGRGELVGRPVAHLLAKQCQVAVVDTSTKDPNSIIITADIVVSAAGVPAMITGEMVQSGAILIDAGTSESYGSVVGDIDTASVSGVAGSLAPVPGGVGPVTVAMLFRNVLLAAKNKFSHAG